MGSDRCLTNDSRDEDDGGVVVVEVILITKGPSEEGTFEQKLERTKLLGQDKSWEKSRPAGASSAKAARWKRCW